jgi:hypothetical protein
MDPGVVQVAGAAIDEAVLVVQFDELRPVWSTWI